MFQWMYKRVFEKSQTGLLRIIEDFVAHDTAMRAHPLAGMAIPLSLTLAQLEHMEMVLKWFSYASSAMLVEDSGPKMHAAYHHINRANDDLIKAIYAAIEAEGSIRIR